MKDDNLGANSTLFGLLEKYLHCVITFVISKRLGRKLALTHGFRKPKIVLGFTSRTLHYKTENYLKNSVGYWNFVY